jgi:hypothetical protein
VLNLIPALLLLILQGPMSMDVDMGGMLGHQNPAVVALLQPRDPESKPTRMWVRSMFALLRSVQISTPAIPVVEGEVSASTPIQPRTSRSIPEPLIARNFSRDGPSRA